MTQDTTQERTTIQVDPVRAQACAETVVAAFASDPIARTLRLPEKVMRRMYSLPLAFGFRLGEVHATSGACDGIMVIVPGERSVFGLGEIVRSGSLGSALRLVRLFFNRTMRQLFTIIERDHKALDIGPYWYLALLAVAPEHQGKGHGGALLRALCSRADAERKAIYLETQSASNESLYRHFGFATVKHVQLDGGVEIWEMVRPAQQR